MNLGPKVSTRSKRKAISEKAGYPSFDLVALQATTPTIHRTPVSRVAPGKSNRSTDHVRRHRNLHHAHTDAIQEASNEEHGNVSRPALDRGRDHADGTDYLNGPAAAILVEDPVDNESTNNASPGEQTIGS